MKIILNGREAQLNGNPGPFCEVSYETIVQMAGHNPLRMLTVTWATRKSQGTITPGMVCQVEEGTVFNVADTSGA